MFPGKNVFKIVGSFSNKVKKKKIILTWLYRKQTGSQLDNKFHLALRNMFSVCRALTPSAYGVDFSDLFIQCENKCVPLQLV